MFCTHKKYNNQLYKTELCANSLLNSVGLKIVVEHDEMIGFGTLDAPFDTSHQVTPERRPLVVQTNKFF